LEASQAWQHALEQLRQEMPKSSFDTWLADSRLVSYDGGRFTVRVRNPYARDWLESRLSTTASRLLAGMMNRSVEVQFVAAESEEPPAEEEVAEAVAEAAQSGGDAEFQARTAYCTLYDRLVQPRTVIVVERYLVLRLLPWIGARAFWLYIGFHQAAWMNLRGNLNGRDSVTTRLAAPNIARYAGVGRATLFRWMKDPETWQNLRGLVKRTHLEAEWDEDRGGNMHKLANEYLVSLTPPLSRADAYSVYGWLATRISEGASLEQALEAALDIPNDKLVGELLLPLELQPTAQEMQASMPQPFLTVKDIARDLCLTKGIPEEVQVAAELVHTKIVHAFGDTAIKVYFVETVIPKTGMTPEQSALVVASRCRTYTNEATGEVRNRIVIPRGCAEMGAWIGTSREKTVWEWMNGEVRRSSGKRTVRGRRKKTEKGIGPIPGFLKVDYPLRGEDRSPWLYVRLMEPLFSLPGGGRGDGGDGTAINGGLSTGRSGGSETFPNSGRGTIKAGGHEMITDGGHGTNKPGDPKTIKNGAKLEQISGFETVDWRTWDVLNDLKYLLTSFRIKTSKQLQTHSETKEVVDNLSSNGWDLKKLLFQSEVYPANVKKLTASGVTPEQYIAWVLYTLSPYGQRLKLDPVPIAIKSLLEDSDSLPPAQVFVSLAKLPKRVLYDLVTATPEAGEGVRTGHEDWDTAMGPTNPKIGELRRMLFGG
jgi:hypothetical protein